jgi:drug/metabolite transporter (DMT)-like permease
MRPADIARLTALAAIWGGSFIFMRILAPVLGPVVTADLRVLIAGIALVVYFRLVHFDPGWRVHWRRYLVIGGVNSAIPFVLYSFAALHIPASYSVILNSTSPFFGALFSAVWLGEGMTMRKISGLILGAVGVAGIVKIGSVNTGEMFYWAVGAGLLAPVCYGISAVYIKRLVNGPSPKGIAVGSQLMAGLLLVPVIPFSPVRGNVTFSVGLAVLGLALLCSAIAYLLYYRLIDDIGPTRALTVTFLMPVFGMVWSVIFLHETITLTMIGGTALILAGTGLVLSFRKKEPVIA